MMNRLFLKGGKRSMMLAMFLMMAMITFAVPAKPGLKRVLTLSDGTTVSAVLVGDEHGHFWKGADGKSYQMVAGTDKFQEVNSQEIIEKAKQRRAKANQRRMKRMAPQKIGSVGAITGDKKGIIILVNFKNKSFTATQSDFNNLANTVNYNSGNYKGSMYDYFYAQSDGQFRLTFDVVGPYTVSQNYSYYGANDSEGNDKYPAKMVIEALQLANNDVDFSDYDWDGDGEVDQVYVVYAGKGAADGGSDDTIWPHEWQLSSAKQYGDGTGAQTLDGVKIDTYACGGEQNGSTGATAGIGTMCHEFSHCLGYPDFYDTDYSGGQGMFEWDLMDSGSYNDDGYQPAGYTSYERWVAGWKTPTTLEYTQTISNMKALQTSGSETYIIYNPGNHNEYFLLENRQKIGWDASLPGKGLLILHVDYSSSAWSNNKPNDDPSHQRMTWIAADNEYQYETYNGTKYYTSEGAANDPYPYGSNNSFSKTSTPAAKLFNENTDNTYYLDSSVENITQNSDGTISFNFVGISNVATPTFSPTAGQYADAQTVTISCETTGATIYYTTNGTTPTTSSSVYSSALTISETTTVKAMAVKDGEESAVATAKYTIGGSSSDPNTTKFKLVTTVSELESGMRYIIACGSQAKAAGALNNSYLNSVAVTVSSDEITISDGVAVFVLEGDQTNGWTFKNESTNTYLYSSAAKSVGYSNTANTWTLSNGTNGVIMTYSTSSYGSMQYNSSSPRFTTYTSSQTEANLYMEYSDGGTTTTTPELIADPETLSFEAEANETQVKTFNILGADLTGNVTVSLSGATSVFSVSPATITKADAEEGATVSVTFSPTDAGTFSGIVTLTSAGAESVTVSLTGTATASATQTTGNDFTLVTSASDFVEGDYIIVYDGGAMNTTVTSNRLQYTEVTPSNNVITTTDAAIIWHIAPSGSYYTIYNAGESKYAAATGSNNQAQLLASGTDDKSLWSVTTGTTFDFVNKSNSRYLRRNGKYGFACYATGTGGALSLYKRTSGSSTTTNNYYQPADGKKGEALKTAMCGIIYNRTEKSYDYLWTAFQTTDVRSDGKIWDMYSNITNYTPVTSGSSYSVEGDCYNREHSWPQSWFGTNTPMYTDLHHIYPTDGYVNGKRANYPFGETNNPTYSSSGSFSKLGPCSYNGYTGTVFEPADEYKGDFARTYFYMVTCYEEKLHDWYTNYSSTDVVNVIDGTTYPALQTWQLNMLMEWAKNDPVSEKETNRNNAVYSIQNNRNPFIDYPGLQEYIWGICIDDAFSYDNYVEPVYKQDVTMIFSTTSVEITEGDSFTKPTLTTNPAGLTVSYESSNTNVATVNASTGDVTIVGTGTTTITATFAGNDSYNSGSASYALTVNAASTPTPAEDSDIFMLVTDASKLSAGDKILIAYVNGTTVKALGTTQNTNNRAAVDVTKNSDNTLTPSESAQVITLEKDGNNFLFNVGTGYLYAASSSKNLLNTEQTADDNAKATISISNGDATITFQGSNTHNTMRYNPNNGSPLFSCYSGTNTGSAPQIYRMIPTITLADASNNASTINAYNGETVNAKLDGRTLYKDGAWNTLCLPFDVNVSGSVLDGATLKELDNSSTLYNGHKTGLDGTTLYLNFKDATSITAGKPYIIKWEGDGINNLENPTFTGVVMGNTATPTDIGSSDGSVTFKGVYGPVNLQKDDTSNLYLTGDNTLSWPNVDNFYVNAFRAYFKLSDANLAREFKLNFGDDEVTTGIFENEELRMRNEELEDGIYDLQGRKMVNGQLKRGLYIVNGKKVVIK